MNITSVELSNYRMHERLSVDFKPGFNVIVGVNGSGKTSLLKAVCDVLYAGFSLLPALSDTMSGPGLAFLRTESINGRYRFEPQYPVAIIADGEAFGHVVRWDVSLSSELDALGGQGVTPLMALAEERARLQRTGRTEADLPLPLLAFYRANRQWNQPRPSELQAATEKVARHDAYKDWNDASLDAAALQGWVIAKCLERFQVSSETGRAFDEIDDDELALVNGALRVAVEGFQGMRYDLKQKSLLVDWEPDGSGARNASGFESLSDGQRAVIGLVADIARRMCVLNPVLGDRAIRETPGVVLIDELDMHLHPRWQRILTAGLKRAFPALQFIVASHSPQVIGELTPDEIILLRPGRVEHPQVSYGLGSSQILEEIMGAEARSVGIEQRLDALFAALERHEFEWVRQEIERLKQEAPGIPELAGAEALLRRKQVLGR